VVLRLAGVDEPLEHQDELRHEQLGHGHGHGHERGRSRRRMPTTSGFPLFSHGACLCADPAGSGGRVRILAIVVAIIGALAELVWIAENWFPRAGSTLRT
jgi:hypothetical protein